MQRRNVLKFKFSHSHLALWQRQGNFQMFNLSVFCRTTLSSVFILDVWAVAEDPTLYSFSHITQCICHYLCRNRTARDPIREHFSEDGKQMHSVWRGNTVQRFTQCFRVSIEVGRNDETRKRTGRLDHYCLSVPSPLDPDHKLHHKHRPSHRCMQAAQPTPADSKGEQSLGHQRQKQPTSTDLHVHRNADRHKNKQSKNINTCDIYTAPPHRCNFPASCCNLC